MFQSFISNTRRWLGKNAAIFIAVFAIAFSISPISTSAQAETKGSAVTTPALPQTTQYFQDIPVGSFWYNYTSLLYSDGIISGFLCGTAPAGPCVPPANLPYYLPNDNVTRGQMSRYVSQARTQPYSTAIVISTSGSIPIALEAKAASGGEAIYAECLTSGNNCYAVEGAAPAGDYAGYFVGGRGVYARSTDDNFPALYAHAYGNGAYGLSAQSYNSYGAYITSTNYPAAAFTSESAQAALFSGVDWGITVRSNGIGPTIDAANLGSGGGVQGISFVDDAGHFDDGGPGNGHYAIYGNGDGAVTGTFVHNLSVGGADAGIMKNVSDVTLTQGDVVVIAGGSSETVMGDTPVANVKLSAAADDSAVVGIVASPIYVPDAATAAAYIAQDNADRAAELASSSEPSQRALKARLSAPGRISSMVGRIHSMDGTDVPANAYAMVVTHGQYQAVKVDASFGAVQAGDLLTTSPHVGYAMKADAKAIANGAVIGKALGSVDSGSGLIPVLVTLR